MPAASAPRPGSVVTITPAPAVDLTYHVDTLRPGEIHRAGATSVEFAGKGVNVTANLTVGGVDSRAVVPLPLEDMSLAEADPRIVASACAGVLRRNVTIIDRAGHTTKINQSATPLSEREWDGLIDAALAEVRVVDAEWLLISGRIPEVHGGVDDYLPMLRERLRPDTSIAVDTSGEIVGPWWASGVIDCIKPNVSELAEATQQELHTLGDVVDAAEKLQRGGIRIVAVSLGADGFLVVDAEQTVWAVSERIDVVNTIGAGDASLAGLLHGLVSGVSITEAARRAAEWGALNAMQPTSQLSALAPTVSVDLREVDRDHPVIAD